VEDGKVKKEVKKEELVRVVACKGLIFWAPGSVWRVSVCDSVGGWLPLNF
jgi:hypothetical protein